MIAATAGAIGLVVFLLALELVNDVKTARRISKHLPKAPRSTK